jgi:HAMP domain-containing protein
MIDLKAWIGVIGTLAGAIVGGAIALVVSSRQLRHQRALERQRRQLANFERIHKCASTVAHQAWILSTQVTANVGAGLPLRSEAFGEKMPSDELRMLVDFYASPLRTYAQRIEEQIQALGRTTAQAVATTNRSDEWKTATVLAVMTAATEIGKAANEMKERLRELAAPYTDWGSEGS